MRAIRSAALAGCVLFALVLVGGASAEGPPRTPAPGGDNSRVQQAGEACKAQGLQPGTDAFKLCVRKALGGGDNSGDNSKERKAGEACKAQGLEPGTDAFKLCMRKALGNGSGEDTGDKSKAKKIGEACKAKGLKPGSDEFKQCVKSATSAKH